MENQEKISENELKDEVYLSKVPYIRIVLASFIVITIAFFLNFPVEQKVTSAIVSALKKNKACPINYSSLDLNLFFFPTLTMKNMNITGQCLGNSRGPGILFDSINVVLQRPTILPPGILIHANAKDAITKLNVYASIGITSASIRVQDSIVDGALIAKAANLPIKLKGSLSVDAILDTDYKQPTGGSFHITSKDLNLPPQRIVILDIKGLSLAPLVLKGTMDKEVVKIQRIQIGNSTTRIEAIFTDGIIKLNKRNSKRHMVDLEGKIRFSAKFLQEFGLITSFLGKATIDNNGFYRIQLKGPIGQIRPSFL